MNLSIAELMDLHTLSWSQAVLRLALACVFGFILGYDRASKNKPVDFRVFVIVSTMACLIAMMSQELHYVYNNEDDLLQLDLGKIIEGVLVGIGFLGAGAIIHRDNSNGSDQVIGTATGASIWASGALGLMTGFGFYALAFLAFCTLVIVLVGFGLLRKPLFNEEENYQRSAQEKQDDISG